MNRQYQGRSSLPARMSAYLKERISPKMFQFSLLQFFYWMAAAAISFTVVFLQEQGLSPTKVGATMAILNVCAIIAPPIWGMLSDKLRSVRKVIMLCVIGGSLFYALVPLSAPYQIGGFSLLFLLFPISGFFRFPLVNLLDSWTIRTAGADDRMSYGGARLWGSIGYAIVSFILGALNAKFGSVAYTFILYGILNIPFFLLCLKQPDEDLSTEKKKTSFKELRLSRLFRNYYFMIFLVVHVLVYLSVQGTFTFLPYLLLDIAGNANALGGVFGAKALFEVPMLLFAGRLVKKFGLTRMIVVGSFLFMLEQVCYIFCPSTVSVFFVMILNGLAFGTYLACYVSYVHKLAPPDLAATAQTMIGSLGALSGVLCNVFGGMIVEAFGVRHFYMATASLQLLAMTLFLVSFPIGKRLLHKNVPPAVYEN